MHRRMPPLGTKPAALAGRWRELWSLGLLISPVAGAGVLVAVVGAVWWVLALRLAPAQDVGMYAAVYGAAVLIAEVGNLGSGYALVRYLPDAGMLAPALVGTGFITITVCIALLVGLLECIIHAFAGYVPIPSGYLVALMLLLAALGTGWFVMINDLLIATGRRNALFRWSAVAASGRVIVLMVVRAHWDLHWYSLVVSYTAPLLFVSFGVLAFTCRDLVGGMCRSPLLRWNQARDYLSYAWQTYLGNLLAAVVPNFLPILVVWRLGSLAGARFAAGWFLVGLMMLVPSAISTTTFAIGARREGGPGRLSSQGMWLVSLVQIPAAACLLVVVPVVLQHLGASYRSLDAQYLVPLVLGAAFAGYTSQIYANVRLIEGGLRVVTLGQLAQATLVLSLSTLLMSDLGLLGVFLAWLLATAATLLGLVLAVSGRLHLLSPSSRGGDRLYSSMVRGASD